MRKVSGLTLTVNPETVMATADGCGIPALSRPLTPRPPQMIWMSAVGPKSKCGTTPSLHLSPLLEKHSDAK